MNTTTIWTIVLSALFGAAFSHAVFSVELTNYDEGFGTGFGKGYVAGKTAALNPTETNHELESTCVGMWVSNQIRKDK